MVFSQLATDQTYYTGLAILNPNAQAVTARVEVYDGNGCCGGEGRSGGCRRAGVEAADGVFRRTGRTESEQRIHAGADEPGRGKLRGVRTWAGTSLSAVPPQRAK